MQKVLQKKEHFFLLQDFFDVAFLPLFFLRQRVNQHTQDNNQVSDQFSLRYFFF